MTILFRTRFIGLIILLMTGTQATFAQTPVDGESKWYVTAAVGQATLELSSQAPGQPIILGDDTDNSWAAGLGYMLNQYISVELNHGDYGTYTVIVNTCPPDAVCILGFLPFTLERAATSLHILPTYPVNERVDVYAKLGVRHWNKRIQYVDDTNNLVLGIGARLAITNRADVALEFEQVDDLEVASLGVRFQF